MLKSLGDGIELSALLCYHHLYHHRIICCSTLYWCCCWPCMCPHMYMSICIYTHAHMNMYTHIYSNTNTHTIYLHTIIFHPTKYNNYEFNLCAILNITDLLEPTLWFLIQEISRSLPHLAFGSEAFQFCYSFQMPGGLSVHLA